MALGRAKSSFPSDSAETPPVGGGEVSVAEFISA
jgi:hypothetical protein